MAELLEDAWKHRVQVHSSLSQVSHEIRDQIKSEYQQTLNKIRSDGATAVQASRDFHIANLKAVEKEISAHMILLKAIRSASGDKIESFNRILDAAKQKMAAFRAEARRTCRAEMATHGAEAKIRQDEFEAESAKRLQALSTQHKVDLANGHKDFQEKPKISFDVYLTLKNRSKAVQNQISHGASRLIAARDRAKLDLKSTKEDIDRRIKEIQRISGEHRKLDRKMEAEIREFERPLRAELAALQIERDDRQRVFDESFAVMRSSSDEVLLNLRLELNHRRSECDALNSQFNGMFKELRTAQQREKDELQNTISSEGLDAIERQKILLTQVKPTKRKQKKEKKATRLNLEQFQKTHSAELEQLEKDQGIELSTLNLEFERQADRIRMHMASKFGETHQNQLKLKAEVDQLNSTKLSTADRHSQAIRDFDSDETQSIISTRVSNASEVQEMKSQFERESDQFQKRNAKSIDDARSNFERQRSDLFARLSADHSTSLSEIENEGYSNMEFNALLSSFQSSLGTFQVDLSQIEPPKIENNSKYKELMAELDRLSADKQERESAQAIDRVAIQSSWELQTGTENERHAKATRAASSGRNRDQLKLSVQNQVADVKRSAEIEIAKRRELLDSKTKRFSESMSRILGLRDQIQNSPEIEGQNAQLIKFRNELQLKLKLALRQRSDEVQKAQSKRDLMETSFSSQISDFLNDIENRQRGFQKTKNSLEAELIRIQNDCDSELTSAINAGGLRTKRIVGSHSAKLAELTSEIQAVRSELSNADRRNRKQLTDECAKQQDQFESLNTQLTTALEGTKSDWVGLLSYLDERIEVLTHSRNALKTKWETRQRRQCDLEVIEQLAQQLKTLQMLLSSKIKDLADYRTMMIEQEKAYNSMFGKSPSVGVLQFVQEVRFGPKSARV
jgi:hypothetical protein